MGNFFYKDQNTTVNNSTTQNYDFITIEFYESNYQLNDEINNESIDWNEIEKSIENFVMKIKEMKEQGIFDIRTDEITILDKDW